jgi:BirA family biotin operon repressor/biotin-[acetyl-CoA-carboxylase] ligase
MESKTDIIWLERVDSTNDEARRHISEIDNLSVVSALEQTKGRGQRGNRWSSQPGENLTFSIVVKDFRIKANEQSAISQATALSLVDLLSRHEIKARIKWPNDIYAGDEKICGILIENSLKGSEIDWSIIGIGLNVNQTAFPEDLPNPTSMKLCTGNSNPYNTREILEEFMGIFTGYYREYLNGNGALDRLEEQFVSNLRTSLSSPR